jgi:hypothetical protein
VGFPPYLLELEKNGGFHILYNFAIFARIDFNAECFALHSIDLSDIKQLKQTIWQQITQP